MANAQGSTGVATVLLPSGLVVSCLQKHDVRLVDREVQGYFSNHLKVRSGDTVFDVGANIGLFALAVYERCQRNVQLYAFEPIQAIFDVLRINVERYDSADQLKIFAFGLSSSSEDLTLSYYPRAPVMSTAYPDEKADLILTKDAILNNIMHLTEAPLAVRCLRWVPTALRGPVVHYALKRALAPQRIVCQMQTLSRVVREHGIERIDLLKIDVEKAELEIFLGIESQDWPKIQQVVVELHDLDGRLATMTALLREHGLTRIVVDQPPTLKQSNIYTVFATRH